MLGSSLDPPGAADLREADAMQSPVLPVQPRVASFTSPNPGMSALEEKTTNRPSGETAASDDGPSSCVPLESTEIAVVVPAPGEQAVAAMAAAMATTKASVAPVVPMGAVVTAVLLGGSMPRRRAVMPHSTPRAAA